MMAGLDLLFIPQEILSRSLPLDIKEKWLHNGYLKPPMALAVAKCFPFHPSDLTDDTHDQEAACMKHCDAPPGNNLPNKHRTRCLTLSAGATIFRVFTRAEHDAAPARENEGVEGVKDRPGPETAEQRRRMRTVYASWGPCDFPLVIASSRRGLGELPSRRYSTTMPQPQSMGPSLTLAIRPERRKCRQTSGWIMRATSTSSCLLISCRDCIPFVLAFLASSIQHFKVSFV